MKCSGHCLQLCVNAALSINAIECLTGAASKLVGHFKHSVVVSKELKKKAKTNGATRAQINTKLYNTMEFDLLYVKEIG